jgi:hypothetical protein
VTFSIINTKASNNNHLHLEFLRQYKFIERRCCEQWGMRYKINNCRWEDHIDNKSGASVIHYNASITKETVARLGASKQNQHAGAASNEARDTKSTSAGEMAPPLTNRVQIPGVSWVTINLVDGWKEQQPTEITGVVKWCVVRCTIVGIDNRGRAWNYATSHYWWWRLTRMAVTIDNTHGMSPVLATQNCRSVLDVLQIGIQSDWLRYGDCVRPIYLEDQDIMRTGSKY